MTYKKFQSYCFIFSRLIVCLGVSGYSHASVNGGVSFIDLSSEADSGIAYSRTESDRDIILDQLKARQSLSFPDLALIPLKSHGSPGIAVFDYDKDGDVDLYVTNGPNTANSLFSNQLIESGETTFIDVAQDAGVSAINMDSSGVCYGDIDNDGYQDLYVLGTGEQNRLFKNQGNGRFVDITLDANLAGGMRNPAGCSMGDVNNDGLLDIVIGNTATSWDNRQAIFTPFAFNDHNQLFINTGHNEFKDVSVQSGINELAGFPSEAAGAAGISWAIAMVDYDLDGDVDIITADDQGGGVLPASLGGVDRGLIHVFNNDGSGKFTDVTVEVGTNVVGDWMGLSFGDINSDGYMDMFVTNIGDYALTVFPRPAPYQLGESASRWFLGQADGSFSDPGTGLLGASVFGWGTVMEDYDNDGDIDIIYHGGGDGGPLIESSNPGVILQNDGMANFNYDLTAMDNTVNHSRRATQGLASGDLNNDGWVDFISVSNLDIPLELPLVKYPVEWGGDSDEFSFFFPTFNPTPQGEFVWTGMEPENGTLKTEINTADNGNNSATVELLGTIGLTSKGNVNRDGIGAIISFTPDKGKKTMRPVLGGASYASQSSLKQVLGLGDASKGTVEILWPGGIRNRFYNLKKSEHLVLPEIPCSFDADWKRAKYYKRCVNRSLRQLQRSGIIDGQFKRRLRSSAMRAFYHHRRIK